MRPCGQRPRPALFTDFVMSAFGGIFYRNAPNLGLPVLVCDAVDQIAPGDLIHVDPATGIDDRTRGIAISAAALPAFLLAMIADGGLMPPSREAVRGPARQVW